MKFDKEHLVEISKLTRGEAEVFVRFLALEKERHLCAVALCRTWVELWRSEEERQLEEVRHIDGGIEKVNKKFGWKEK